LIAECEKQLRAAYATGFREGYLDDDLINTYHGDEAKEYSRGYKDGQKARDRKNKEPVQINPRRNGPPPVHREPSPTPAPPPPSKGGGS